MVESRRALLIGYGPTAEAALRSLLPCVEVTAVIRDTTAPLDPVVRLAGLHGVPLFGPSSPDALRRIVAKTQPDCIVISSYDHRLDGDLQRACPLVKVHYAPLPRYRGSAPVNWAIINGEPSAAISVHLVDEGLDSGNLVFQEEIDIGPQDTATSLYTRLDAIQQRHLGEAVLRVLSGCRGHPQDPSQATYGCARDPEDGEIRWADPAPHIERLVRALTPPFPGAFTYLEGRRLIVRRAARVGDLPTYSGIVPGRVVRLSWEEGWIDVLAGEGALRIFELEQRGKNPVRATTVVRSTKATLGLRNGDLLRRMAELEVRVEGFLLASVANAPTA
ncbi:MAG: methionyl-tRNA formyltransferase [Geminicoccaceae bacterium]